MDGARPTLAAQISVLKKQVAAAEAIATMTAGRDGTLEGTRGGSTDANGATTGISGGNSNNAMSFATAAQLVGLPARPARRYSAEDEQTKETRAALALARKRLMTAPHPMRPPPDELQPALFDERAADGSRKCPHCHAGLDDPAVRRSHLLHGCGAVPRSQSAMEQLNTTAATRLLPSQDADISIRSLPEPSSMQRPDLLPALPLLKSVSEPSTATLDSRFDHVNSLLSGHPEYADKLSTSLKALRTTVAEPSTTTTFVTSEVTAPPLAEVTPLPNIMAEIELKTGTPGPDVATPDSVLKNLRIKRLSGRKSGSGRGELDTGSVTSTSTTSTSISSTTDHAGVPSPRTTSSGSLSDSMRAKALAEVGRGLVLASPRPSPTPRDTPKHNALLSPTVSNDASIALLGRSMLANHTAPKTPRMPSPGQVTSPTATTSAPTGGKPPLSSSLAASGTSFAGDESLANGLAGIGMRDSLSESGKVVSRPVVPASQEARHKAGGDVAPNAQLGYLRADLKTLRHRFAAISSKVSDVPADLLDEATKMVEDFAVSVEALTKTGPTISRVARASVVSAYTEKLQDTLQAIRTAREALTEIEHSSARRLAARRAQRVADAVGTLARAQAKLERLRSAEFDDSADDMEVAVAACASAAAFKEATPLDSEEAVDAFGALAQNALDLVMHAASRTGSNRKLAEESQQSSAAASHAAIADLLDRLTKVEERVAAMQAKVSQSPSLEQNATIYAAQQRAAAAMLPAQALTQIVKGAGDKAMPDYFISQMTEVVRTVESATLVAEDAIQEAMLRSSMQQPARTRVQSTSSETQTDVQHDADSKDHRGDTAPADSKLREAVPGSERTLKTVASMASAASAASSEYSAKSDDVDEEDSKYGRDRRGVDVRRAVPEDMEESIDVIGPSRSAGSSARQLRTQSSNGMSSIPDNESVRSWVDSDVSGSNINIADVDISAALDSWIRTQVDKLNRQLVKELAVVPPLREQLDELAQASPPGGSSRHVRLEAEVASARSLLKAVHSALQHASEIRERLIRGPMTVTTVFAYIAQMARVKALIAVVEQGLDDCAEAARGNGVDPKVRASRYEDVLEQSKAALLTAEHRAEDCKTKLSVDATVIAVDRAVLQEGVAVSRDLAEQAHDAVMHCDCAVVETVASALAGCAAASKVATALQACVEVVSGIALGSAASVQRVPSETVVRAGAPGRISNATPLQAQYVQCDSLLTALQDRFDAAVDKANSLDMNEAATNSESAAAKVMSSVLSARSMLRAARDLRKALTDNPSSLSESTMKEFSAIVAKSEPLVLRLEREVINAVGASAAPGYAEEAHPSAPARASGGGGYRRSVKAMSSNRAVAQPQPQQPSMARPRLSDREMVPDQWQDRIGVLKKQLEDVVAHYRSIVGYLKENSLTMLPPELGVPLKTALETAAVSVKRADAEAPNAESDDRWTAKERCTRFEALVRTAWTNVHELELEVKRVVQTMEHDTRFSQRADKGVARKVYPSVPSFTGGRPHTPGTAVDSNEPGAGVPRTSSAISKFRGAAQVLRLSQPRPLTAEVEPQVPSSAAAAAGAPSGADEGARLRWKWSWGKKDA